MLDRRAVLVGLLGALGGCSALRGRQADLERNSPSTIASDLADQVYVEARKEALPTPEDSPALGMTNDGVFQYTDSADEWVPFAWANAFDVTDNGQLRIGTGSAPLESMDVREINTVPQLRPRAEAGEGTKADPFVIPADLLEDYHGLVDVGRGWFETEGLATSETYAYDETAVYLAGDGMRTTTLQHRADAPQTPTVHFRGAGGNFGGIHDMTVYGAGEGEMGAGSAPIVKSDGEIIDLQFRNVIIRWGGGDVLQLASSSSGTRVQNVWLENAPGWALNIDGGSRVKVNGVHTTGTHGGIRTNGTIGNFSDLTITNTWGHNGIDVLSSGNNFSNVILQSGLDRGFKIHGDKTTISNVLIEETNGAAFYVAGTAAISNAIVRNSGAEGESVLRIFATGTAVSNVWAKRTDPDYTTRLVELDADRCYLDGVGGDPTEEWELAVASGATENVIEGLVGVSSANITDAGTRTLINGWGTNDGDPASRGEWNGHADYAGMMGATIWDTTTEPWTAYEVSPAGEWI